MENINTVHTLIYKRSGIEKNSNDEENTLHILLKENMKYMALTFDMH